MKINRVITYLLILTFFSFLSVAASAISAKDIALAQKAIAQIVKMSEQYDDVELTAPEPLSDTTGKYVSPYLNDGEITQWANKSITAEAGAQAGAVAGDAAANTIAKKIPFGGLLRKKTKSVATSAGTATALGGWDSIRESSEASFDNMRDYAIYLHVTHSDKANYDQTLAATMNLYPELKKGYK